MLRRGVFRAQRILQIFVCDTSDDSNDTAVFSGAASRRSVRGRSRTALSEDNCQQGQGKAKHALEKTTIKIAHSSGVQNLMIEIIQASH